MQIESTRNNQSAKSSPFLLILLLATFWGPSFLFLKLIVEEIAPITLVSLRFSLGVIFLLLALRFQNILLPRSLALWGHAAVMGLLVSSLPVFFCAYSLQYIDSVISALINGSIPVLTVLLAHILLEGEPLTYQKFTGIALGLGGVFVLFLPPLLISEHYASPYGMLWSFLAAISYACGMVYARKFIKVSVNPLVLPTLQLMSTLIYLIPLSLIFDSEFNIAFVPLKTWALLSGLVIFGTVSALIVYYRIVLNYSATALSMATYLVPIFSTIYGVVFLKEKLSLYFYAATLLILTGTVLCLHHTKIFSKNNLIKWKFRSASAED